MIDKQQAEKVAKTLERAWTVKHEALQGSTREADAFLAWLKSYCIVPTKHEMYRTLEKRARETADPDMVSQSEDLAVYWYIERDALWGYATGSQLIVIPDEALPTMPNVKIDDIQEK
jgi:hypothetical protein